MKRTFIYTTFLDRVLVLQSRSSPADEEWVPYMTLLQEVDATVGGDLTRTGLVVFTDGGAPTTKQRGAVNQWLRGRKYPTSIVARSQLIRGVVTAMNWFNSEIRIFAPHSVADAMRHIGIQREAEMSQAFTQLVDLSRSLEAPNDTLLAAQDALRPAASA